MDEEDIQTKLQQVFNHPAFVPAAVGVAAFAGGLGLGYILGKRHRKVVFIETKIESHEEPEFELDVNSILEQGYIGNQLMEEDNDVEEQEDVEDPRGLSLGEEEPEEDKEAAYREVAARFVEERIQRTIETRQGVSSEPEVVNQSIFANNGDDGWDYEAEVTKRTKTEPYILHKDEFFDDEEGYIQLTLTYYEGDDILVDEEEAPIYNHASVVGPLKFGHGSGDPNVFYVRNDKRRCEYEILRHEGLYSREVLGLDIENNVRVRQKHDRELRHSDYDRKFKLE